MLIGLPPAERSEPDEFARIRSAVHTKDRGEVLKDPIVSVGQLSERHGAVLLEIGPTVEIGDHASVDEPSQRARFRRDHTEAHRRPQAQSAVGERVVAGGYSLGGFPYCGDGSRELRGDTDLDVVLVRYRPKVPRLRGEGDRPCEL